MLLDRVRDTIERYQMLSKGMRVGVALSGGVDSMVLLHLLNRLADELVIELWVCHLNHNLRGEESRRDELFVKRVAQSMGLELISKRLRTQPLPKGVSIQSWARQRRLDFLKEAAREHGLHRIALGHNMDDNAETMIMRLATGTSPDGLKGIEPVRDIFIRPLIETTRKEIEQYAESHSIEYVEDSTNRSSKYLRNRIRHGIMKAIKEQINPSVVEGLWRLSCQMRRDAKYLSGVAQRLFEHLADSSPQGVWFDIEELNRVEEAMITRLLFKALGQLKPEGMRFESHQADTFLAVLRSSKPNLSVHLADGIYIKRVYGRIGIAREPGQREATEVCLPVKLNLSGITDVGMGYRLRAELMEGRVEVVPDRRVAYFDYDRLPEPLVVRCFQEGDRIEPFGMKGVKKLKDLFIDEKVPLEERRRIPLLLAGERIVWVAGIRRAEGYRVREDTERVLKVELIKDA